VCNVGELKVGDVINTGIREINCPDARLPHSDATHEANLNWQQLIIRKFLWQLHQAAVFFMSLSGCLLV